MTISKYCIGEFCWCGQIAKHKVEEVVFDDDPQPIRHPLTSYLCRQHFIELMGNYAKCKYGDVR